MRDKRKKRIVLVTAALVAALLLFVLLNICIGSVSIAPSELPGLIFGDGKENDSTRRILLELRIPRSLMAVILGGALALSGLLLQSFFENPIAGPFVLGISSGARLLVAAALVLSINNGFKLSSYGMVAAAFVGSMIIVGVLLLISRKLAGGAVLLVAGIMVGYICTAVTDILIELSEDQNVVSLHNWSMGTFSGTRWEHVGIAAVIIFVLFIVSLFLAKPMQACFLGEAAAASLGVNLKRFRVVLILTTSLLAATVTAFAGPVSFVGIAVPFLIRTMTGTERTKVTVPLSFLGGSVFCLIADLLSRTILAPSELSLSVVTSILGAPIVIIMLLLRQRKGAGRW